MNGKRENKPFLAPILIVLTAIALATLWFFGAAQIASAATCNSVQNGNWNVTSTWNCGQVPGSGDDVYIDTIVTIAQPQSVRSITISNELEAQDNLTVHGNFRNNGIFSPFGSTVWITGTSGDQTVGYDPTQELVFANLVIDNDGSAGAVTIQDLIEVTGTLTVTTGALLDVGDNYVDVTGALVNDGEMRHARVVDGSTVPITVTFLEIGSIAYRGVEIWTDQDLGTVTVTVQGNADSCTDNPTSPAYARRCYAITPTNNGAARVVLWALDTERNGITTTSLAPYRFDTGVGWQKLVTVTNGTGSGGYVYAQGQTSGFSDFLMGDTDSAPTAVTLRILAVSSLGAGSPGRALGIGLAVAAPAAGIIALYLHRRREKKV